MCIGSIGDFELEVLVMFDTKNGINLKWPNQNLMGGG
jgi:hypothetical protein